MLLLKIIYFQEQKFYLPCVSKMVLWASKTVRNLFVVELVILLTNITLMVAEILERL
jgi:hypothetical protein